MHDGTDISGIIAGVLEAGLAFYAIWLNRYFKRKYAGLALFLAFASLAALQLSRLPMLSRSLPAPLLTDLTQQIVYAAAALLMLVGWTQIHALGKRCVRAETGETATLGEIDERVEKKTDELTRMNERLIEKVATLQAEITHQKQAQEQMEHTHKELLAVSRQAGMSEVATGVLHNVGNVLNSVNVSTTLLADHLTALNIENITRAATMMREHLADIGDFLNNDPKGKRLPEYFSQIGRHLSDERTLLLKEIGFVRSRIEHIKEIVAAQQNFGKAFGVVEKVRIEELIEDVLRIQGTELTQFGVEVRREYATPLPDVVTDKHKALQILLNLVTNAKHACADSKQEAKRLTVRVTNGEERIRVAMIDNGVGIPTDNLKKIFNHGFTTRKNGGHGFGLHSGALTAKELGGTLTAHSEGPGTGATFTLEIPVKKHSTPSKA